MDRKKAQAVLEAVQNKYAEWIKELCPDPRDQPQLMENYDGAPFAVAWESGSPDEWALAWHGDGTSKDPKGTFCEPIFTFVLGIYDEHGLEWNRVKRGGKFAHKYLITEDRKPETCYITRVERTGGAVDTVFYRVGDPKVGILNKASGEYFAKAVISFWED